MTIESSGARTGTYAFFFPFIKSHLRRRFPGQVVHVAMPFSADRNLLLIAHKLEPPKTFPRFAIRKCTRPMACQRICGIANNVC